MNIALPNPARGSDQIAAILAALSGTVLSPVVPAVTPSAPASTTQTYVVLATVGGAQVPSAAASTTTGAASLSASAYNTISWQPQQGPFGVPVTYNVYRTVGGANQGLIASNLSFPAGVTPSFIDNGVNAVSATTPVFNTSGLLSTAVQEEGATLTGSADAITIPAGVAWINSTGVDACTLANPVSGANSAGGMDQCTLTIYCLSAHAHTVTTGTNGINGASHVITFSAAALNFITLIAKGGTWYVKGSLNATIS